MIRRLSACQLSTPIPVKAASQDATRLRTLTRTLDVGLIGTMDNDLSEAAEEVWCAEQSQDVSAYLAREGFVSPHVGEWPAWHIPPVVAVWAIESQQRPGWVGWWAISGDLPTDYVTCGEERGPRQALRDIGQRWRDAAALWALGERCDTMNFGSTEREKELGPLLAVRAELLLEFAADDSLWED